MLCPFMYTKQIRRCARTCIRSSPATDVAYHCLQIVNAGILVYTLTGQESLSGAKALQTKTSSNLAARSRYNSFWNLTEADEDQTGPAHPFPLRG